MRPFAHDRPYTFATWRRSARLARPRWSVAITLGLVFGCDRSQSAPPGPLVGSDTPAHVTGGDPMAKDPLTVDAYLDPKAGAWKLNVKAGGGEPLGAEPVLTALCSYDPKQKRWTEMGRAAGDLFPAAGGVIDVSRLLRREPIGLFYARVRVGGHEGDTLIYLGPVKPNDVKVAPPPRGMIVAAVPYEDRAVVDYVPDPAVHCSATTQPLNK
jgi:hypothetical protein